MSADEAQPNAALVIRNGGFEGMLYTIHDTETLIGRNPTTDITLLDEGISREHALISYDDGQSEFLIEDLQSTNGVRVNGKRVRQATLTDRDRLQIGSTVFEFRIGDAPSGGTG